MTTAPASVYALVNADGEVIYIGCSITPAERLAAHRRKSWGEEIARMEILGEWPRGEAEAIEHEAIYQRQPRHNVASKDGLTAVEYARKRAAEVRDLDKAKGAAA